MAKQNARLHITQARTIVASVPSSNAAHMTGLEDSARTRLAAYRLGFEACYALAFCKGLPGLSGFREGLLEGIACGLSAIVEALAVVDEGISPEVAEKIRAVAVADLAAIEAEVAGEQEVDDVLLFSHVSQICETLNDAKLQMPRDAERFLALGRAVGQLYIDRASAWNNRGPRLYDLCGIAREFRDEQLGSILPLRHFANLTPRTASVDFDPLEELLAAVGASEDWKHRSLANRTRGVLDATLSLHDQISSTILDPNSNAQTHSRPSWDGVNCVLSFGGQRVKKIRNKNSARNVRKVLEAFEELGWPETILDPLHGGKNVSRLTETVRSLNTGCNTIRFHGDGSSTGYAWRLTEVNEE